MDTEPDPNEPLADSPPVPQSSDEQTPANALEDTASTLISPSSPQEDMGCDGSSETRAQPAALQEPWQYIPAESLNDDHPLQPPPAPTLRPLELPAGIGTLHAAVTPPSARPSLNDSILRITTHNIRAAKAWSEANDMFVENDISGALSVYTRILSDINPGYPAAFLNRALCYLVLDYPSLAAVDSYRAYQAAEWARKKSRGIKYMNMLISAGKTSESCMRRTGSWATEAHRYPGPKHTLLGQSLASLTVEKRAKQQRAYASEQGFYVPDDKRRDLLPGQDPPMVKMKLVENDRTLIEDVQMKALYRLAVALWKCGGGAIRTAEIIIGIAKGQIGEEEDREAFEFLETKYWRFLEERFRAERLAGRVDATGRDDEGIRGLLRTQYTRIKRELYPWDQWSLSSKNLSTQLGPLSEVIRKGTGTCYAHVNSRRHRTPFLSLHAARDVLRGEVIFSEVTPFNVINIPVGAMFRYCDNCAVAIDAPHEAVILADKRATHDYKNFKRDTQAVFTKELQEEAMKASSAKESHNYEAQLDGPSSPRPLPALPRSDSNVVKREEDLVDPSLSDSEASSVGSSTLVASQDASSGSESDRASSVSLSRRSGSEPASKVPEAMGVRDRRESNAASDLKKENIHEQDMAKKVEEERDGCSPTDATKARTLPPPTLLLQQTAQVALAASAVYATPKEPPANRYPMAPPPTSSHPAVESKTQTKEGKSFVYDPELPEDREDLNLCAFCRTSAYCTVKCNLAAQDKYHVALCEKNLEAHTRFLHTNYQWRDDPARNKAVNAPAYRFGATDDEGFNGYVPTSDRQRLQLMMFMRILAIQCPFPLLSQPWCQMLDASLVEDRRRLRVVNKTCVPWRDKWSDYPPSLDSIFPPPSNNARHDDGMIAWSFENNVVRPLFYLWAIGGPDDFMSVQKFDGWMLNTLLAKLDTNMHVSRYPRQIKKYSADGILTGTGFEDLEDYEGMQADFGEPIVHPDDLWIASLNPIATLLRSPIDIAQVLSKDAGPCEPNTSLWEVAGQLMCTTTKDAPRKRYGSMQPMYTNKPEKPSFRQQWFGDTIGLRKGDLLIRGGVWPPPPEKRKDSIVGMRIHKDKYYRKTLQSLLSAESCRQSSRKESAFPPLTEEEWFELLTDDSEIFESMSFQADDNVATTDTLIAAGDTVTPAKRRADCMNVDGSDDNMYSEIDQDEMLAQLGWDGTRV